jgi:hypothetical protein
VRNARGQQATSLAPVLESPLANNVTSCPCLTSSSVKYETTRSVPPYCWGGTLSYSGETCAILIDNPFDTHGVDHALININVVAEIGKDGVDYSITGHSFHGD